MSPEEAPPKLPPAVPATEEELLPLKLVAADRGADLSTARALKVQLKSTAKPGAKYEVVFVDNGEHLLDTSEWFLMCAAKSPQSKPQKLANGTGRYFVWNPEFPEPETAAETA